ncbi:hypothetical protein IVA78_01840 [Bradyrhizobium sp. 137]|uniref:IS66 family transposase n=1 Tax=Bradyrhizobium sp. 137 TaxID=2782614 RepID=UPI001FF93C83|nr:IS66 family transposase [Bradyrhizobium sp. 137]MCK1753995.1 hypothetical protein [Bradyrhizobium sp. 137]
MPLIDAIRSHVFVAERIHAADSNVLDPRIRPGRAGAGPTCATTGLRLDLADVLSFYSPDRGGAHPEQHLAGHAALMQANAYADFVPT